MQIILEERTSKHASSTIAQCNNDDDDNVSSTSNDDDVIARVDGDANDSVDKLR